jgi:uncharacterized membrane protein
MNDSILIVPLLTGPIFIIAGFLLYKFPPKKINHWYGYRTASSMKNQAQWDFAQTYSGKEMMKLGAGLMAASFLGYLIDISKSVSAITGLFIMLVGVGALFARVEKAIKQNFSNKNQE